MKCVALCLWCVFAAGFAARLASPVTRVVKLLEELKGKIVSDSGSETQTYNKFACWCEKTATRKADLVVTGGDNLRSVGQQILKLKGEVATLTYEIAALKKSVKESEDEQESLTAIRSKQNAAYQSESDETKQALGALQQAIKVLAQATAPGVKKADALLQENSELQGRDAVKNALSLLPTSVPISAKHISVLSEFTKAKHGYSPQSGTIQGILGDMYATFSSDLESSTVTEATRNTDFEKTISSMQQEVIDMTKSKESKEGKKADAESFLADSTGSYDDTEAQVKADTAFFDSTKDACEAKSSEWTTRSKLREEELEGIQKAITMLTSDEARELFAKSIKPGMETFLQVSKDSSSPAFKAYSAIRTQARKAKSLRLASLAATVRLAKVGHFDTVIKAIDDMVQTLKDEGNADIQKRDQCNNQYQDIASNVADLSWKVQKNEAALDKFEKLIAMRTAEKAQTEEEIKSVDAEMAEMTKTREAEHNDFQTAKKDDEDAITLLTKAKDSLSSFYEKNDVALGPIQGSVKLFSEEPAFDVSKDQAPEAKFSDKGSHKGESKGAISALAMIIEDLEDEVKNGVRDEVAAQTEYEKSMDTAKKLRASLVEKKVNLNGRLAKRNKDKTDENKDMKSNIEDKDAKLKFQGEIKPDCDWIIKNFDSRAASRSAEMNGLEGAKEYLAGKAPQALLETFDDNVLSSVKFLGLKQ